MSRAGLHVRAFARLFVAVLSAVALFSMGVSGPAAAHGKKKHGSTEQVQQPGQTGAANTEAAQNAAAGHGQTGEVMDGMDMGMDRSSMSLPERLLDWFGRLHPLVVHFPIAFFPAALFTAIVGRKRAAFATPVQFLVVAGGIFSPIAAGAGWLAGMGADPEPVLAYHRWLGVAIGLAGTGLGIWAWRRPWEDRGSGMILALTIMTIAIAVQGFLGASVTHGMDHMMF